jgi:hypothetical protein
MIFYREGSVGIAYPKMVGNSFAATMSGRNVLCAYINQRVILIGFHERRHLNIKGSRKLR